MTHACELFIPGLRLWLSIGCTAEERLTPQPIDIEIRITFQEELGGCKSDNLSEVVCYKTLVEQIVTALQHQSFHLIEFLATQITDIVANNLPPLNILIEVSVIKAQHCIPNLLKPVVFKYFRRAP